MSVCCYYSREVLLILILMILFGAGRTISIKIFYQMGYDDPLLVTVLILIAHSLALPLYWVTKWLVPEDIFGEKKSVSSSTCGNSSKDDDDSDDEECDPTVKDLGDSSSMRLPVEDISFDIIDCENPASSPTITCTEEGPSLEELSDEFKRTKTPRASRNLMRAQLECGDDPIVSSLKVLEGVIQYYPDEDDDDDFDFDGAIDEEVERHQQASTSNLWKPTSMDPSDEEKAPAKRQISFSDVVQEGKEAKLEKEEEHAPTNECHPVPTATTIGDEETAESEATSDSGEVSSNNNGDSNDSRRTLQKGLSRRSSQGSFTGLNDRSLKAAKWAHRIPWWAQPMLSSLFGVLDIAFRALSVLYLAASMMEMLSAGLELIFSVLAAKFIRKREIPRQRWFGAGIMVIGLVLVALSDVVSSTESSQSLGLGIMFVILKSLSQVLRDLSQEIFTQETEFPATLLLGMEGFYGLLVALPLYFLVGPMAGDSPVENFSAIGESAFATGYTIGMVCVVFMAGVFSILGTAVTSSMTKTMWKNFRGLVVWIVALVVYYASDNHDLGEPWTIPGSLFILGGFTVMMGALYVYYRQPRQANMPDGTTKPESLSTADQIDTTVVP